nr:insulinase family protein [uncultured Niameybacter sp.]
MKKIRKYSIYAIVVFILSMTIIVSGKSNTFVLKQETVYGEDVLHEYKHVASGLNVVWIKNKDKNKCFTLGVKTPTTDNTGVNHIIEHAIFTGSKKYPSSTLFFDASSKYPNLFMNAMTSSDMTMFPFATSHEACFEALLSIYLDSILNPTMTYNPSSFYEEAFHYNPDTKEYGGVVYNEMKGASLDKNRQVFRAIRQGIYEGTHYANDSGGEPSAIPDLTYEKFIKTYKDFYFPSNMMIILYGDLPIDHVLDLINEHFKDLPLEDRQVNVNVKPTFKEDEKTLYFTGGGKKGYLIKSFVVEKDLTSNEMLEMDLWVSTYLVDEKSYFIESLKRQGISHVQIIKDSYVKYPSYSIVLSDIQEDKKEQVKAVLESVLANLEKGKLEQDIEQSIIVKNQIAAYSEELSPTRGIEIAQTYLDAWAHDKFNQYYFSDKEHIGKMQKVPDTYRKLLLESPSLYIHLVPSGISKGTQNIVDKSQDWNNILAKMGIWQKETKHLPLPDIDLEELIVKEVLPYKVVDKDGIKYVLTENTGPLKSTSIYLPTNHIKQEDLPYLFLYSRCLKKAANEQMPFKALVDVDILATGYDEVEPYIKISFLSHQDFDALAFYEEVKEILKQKDNKWYKDQLKTFTNDFNEKFSQDLLGTLKWLNAGGQEGYKRYLYEQHYPLYEWVTKFKLDKEGTYVEKIKDIGEVLVYRDGTMIGIQGDKAFRKSQLEQMEKCFNKREKTETKKETYTFVKKEKLTLYYKSTPVDYLVLSYDKGSDLVDGVDYVMASYMTNQYLRPIIRAEHGAYGSSIVAKYPSSLVVYTYRDPNFLASLKTIQEAPQVLRQNLNSEALKVARLDALAEYQRQMGLVGNAFEKGSFIEHTILMGKKPEACLKLQRQILKTTLKNLDEKFSLLPYLLGNSQLGICTGNKQIKPQNKANIYRER